MAMRRMRRMHVRARKSTPCVGGPRAAFEFAGHHNRQQDLKGGSCDQQDLQEPPLRPARDCERRHHNRDACSCRAGLEWLQGRHRAWSECVSPGTQSQDTSSYKTTRVVCLV